MRNTLILFAILFLPATGFSATIHVPGVHPTIQAAIDSAKDGDTLIVAPGFYVENIIFNGKAITLRSSHGPSVTTIDGSRTLSVVRFLDFEGPGSVLDGFTITNGSGTPYLNSYLKSVCGGGVFCNQSSPTIINNIIEENDAKSGGGICGWFGASPLISSNVIRYNTSNAGGGILMEVKCCPFITNNVIYNNYAQGGGGGISCHSSGTMPKIINNTIFENIAGNRGGGIRFMMCTASKDQFVRNTILWNNTAYTSGPEIYVGGLTTVDLAYSNIKDGMDSIGTDGSSQVTWGDHIIDADPLFVNIAAGNFHLSKYSPCINRGCNSGIPTYDMDGDPRPYMGTADMGADEFIDNLALESDVFTMPEKGGQVNFTLDAGNQYQGRDYLLLGCISGSTPGIQLPGGLCTLPINWDCYTNVIYQYLNTNPFHNFQGQLDVSGTGSAQLNMGASSGTVGLTMHYAYLLYNPTDLASNQIEVEIVP